MMSRSEKQQRTQWTAQFLAAAELVRNGYTVAFTMGNTPMSDLAVGRPEGPQFRVQIKGLSSNNAWLIKRRPTQIDLFFVLVRVAKSRDKDEFFVLTHRQINELLNARISLYQEKGIRDIGGGILWNDVAPCRDKWTILPGWRDVGAHEAAAIVGRIVGGGKGNAK